MDVLGWLWAALWSLVKLLWTVVWFLLGGWVVTAIQLIVVIGVVFVYKYGWTRATVELAGRLTTFGRFVWSWVRTRERPPSVATLTSRSPDRDPRRQRMVGDVNLSTMLSLVAMGGLSLLLII